MKFYRILIAIVLVLVVALGLWYGLMQYYERRSDGRGMLVECAYDKNHLS